MAQLLSNSPKFSTRIRSLTISGGGSDGYWVALVPIQLPNLKGLKHLTLRNIDLDARYPNFYKNFTRFRSLEELHLENITYSRHSHLTRLASITETQRLFVYQCICNSAVDFRPLALRGSRIAEVHLDLPYAELKRILTRGWDFRVPKLSHIYITVDFPNPWSLSEDTGSVWSAVANLFRRWETRLPKDEPMAELHITIPKLFDSPFVSLRRCGELNVGFLVLSVNLTVNDLKPFV